jgi:hypothetical protein
MLLAQHMHGTGRRSGARIEKGQHDIQLLVVAVVVVLIRILQGRRVV